ncbi:MAG: glycosyltransferase [Alphaproteobacteria bacterium]|nr:glycosyltransferase [Alphaproteobacteria bacterium]
MRIVILIRSLGIGGAERQVTQLAQALAESGSRVTVVTFYPGGPFFTTLAASGIKVVSLDKKGRLDVIGFSFRFIRTMIRENPTILYTHLDVPNVLGAFVRCFRPRMRLIWALLISDMPSRAYGRVGAIFRRAEGWLSFMPDAIISNSFVGRDDAIRRGFPADRISVVPNGIDTDWFHPDRDARSRTRAQWDLSDEDIVIGVVARLDPMKGHDVILNAAARLISGEPRLRLAFVGDGDPALKNKLAHQADGLGVTPALIWAGPREDMTDVYNAFDIFCLPSRYGEGMPNAVAEAMACALPCIVSDVGDAAMLVGAYGEVTPPGNVESLVRAFALTLALTPAHKAARSAGARSRIVEHFGGTHHGAAGILGDPGPRGDRR